MYRELITANTKHLYNICAKPAQCHRRWSNIVQIVYKCIVFIGKSVVDLLNLTVHNSRMYSNFKYNASFIYSSILLSLLIIT